MRIEFERTGGFAGRKIQGSLDSSALSAPDARKLKQLLEKSRFFDLPETLDSTQPGADFFFYTVTVEDERGKHTVQATDAAIPAPMRPLLEFLRMKVSG